MWSKQDDIFMCVRVCVCVCVCVCVHVCVFNSTYLSLSQIDELCINPAMDWMDVDNVRVADL